MDKVVTMQNWQRTHDYTEEIIRCVDFMVLQMCRGRDKETAFHQSVGSYGFHIALNALKAIERNKHKFL